MTSKTDAAYEALERLITFRHLTPGTTVTEAQLGKRLGLGRTPIRDALQRLVGEGMVEILPRNGVLIPPISFERQFKLIEVRRALEGLAVRLAVQRQTADQRAAMTAMVDELRNFPPHSSTEAFGDVLGRSHRAVNDASHNEPLARAIGPSQALTRRYWFATMQDPLSELPRGANLHANILAAISSGKSAEAANASAKLLDYLTKFTIESMDVGINLPSAQQHLTNYSTNLDSTEQ